MLKRVRARFDQVVKEQQTDSDGEPYRALRPYRSATKRNVLRFWEQAASKGVQSDKDQIADARSLELADSYSSNIENFVGTIKVPVGVMGPLRLNGLNARGDFMVPLATTEAALVASYSRGAVAASQAGGINTAVTRCA